MATKFNVGDLVQLKSGGPSMTIAEFVGNDDKKARCVWFKGASKEMAVFELEILQAFVPPAKK